MNYDEILTRAKTMFERGNYGIALDCFMKIPEASRSAEIAEKIDLCESGLAKERASVVLKKAKRSLKKKKPAQALAFFKDAYALAPEVWILNKINSLENESASDDILIDAETAEMEGRFTVAVDLYGKLLDTKSSLALAVRRLFNLARIGDECTDDLCETLTAFALNDEFNADSLTEKEKYELGYAFAIGRNPFEALTIWRDLECEDELFALQKVGMESLWDEQLYNKFRENQLAADEMRAEAEKRLEFGASATAKNIIKSIVMTEIAIVHSIGDFQQAMNLLRSLEESWDLSDIPVALTLLFKMIEEAPEEATKEDFMDVVDYLLTTAFNTELAPFAFSPDDSRELAVVIFKKLYELSKEFKSWLFLRYSKVSTHIFDLKEILLTQEKGHLTMTPAVMRKTRLNEALLDACDGLLLSPLLLLDMGRFGASEDLYFRDVISYAKFEKIVNSMQFACSDESLGGVEFEMALLSCCEKDFQSFRRHLSRSVMYLKVQGGISSAFNYLLVKALPFEAVKIIDDTLSKILTKLTNPEDVAVVTDYALERISRQFQRGDNPKPLTERLKRIFKDRGDSLPEEFDEMMEEVDLKAVTEALNRKNVSEAARIAKKSGRPTVIEEFFSYADDVITMFEEELDEDDHAFARIVRKFLPHCEKLNPNHPLTGFLRDKMTTSF